MIPFLDLARLHESIRPEIDEAISRVIGASSYVGGEEVTRFEEAFGAAHGAAAAAGCGSGTDALELALRALGVATGDEVIVPAMTFIATAEAVVAVGAVPVVADVDPETLLLTPESVATVRSDRTTAVIPVHLYGHVVPFPYLRQWRSEGLIVVEDAAQAHLATWEGHPIGSTSDAACFSFYPGKNLGALGDGGMVLSGAAPVIEEVARLRDHGRRSKYVHDVPGRCSRLDGLQAAVLATKLGHLERWTEARRLLAAEYRKRLDGVSEVVPWEDGAVHHLLVARVSDRDRVRATLAEAGIATGVHYPVPLSQQPWLAATGAESAPAAEQAGLDVLSLPMDPLMAISDVAEVAEELRGSLD